MTWLRLLSEGIFQTRRYTKLDIGGLPQLCIFVHQVVGLFPLQISLNPQSKTSVCTRFVEAEQLQDDEPFKSTFFNSSSQLLRNVLICLYPDWSFQDRVEKSRACAWFFTRVKRGPYLDGAC